MIENVAFYLFFAFVGGILGIGLALWAIKYLILKGMI